MANESKDGLTFYGFLAYLIEEKGFYILLCAVTMFIGGILFVHFNAKPGTKITILGVIEYTKGEKKSSDNKSIMANDWLGSWKHTAYNANGPNSGVMFFYSPICKDNEYQIFGFHENYRCEMTLLYGNLKANGKILEGIWDNSYTGKKGTFLLNLKDSKSFVGNYAMDKKRINENMNKWTGIRIDK